MNRKPRDRANENRVSMKNIIPFLSKYRPVLTLFFLQMTSFQMMHIGGISRVRDLKLLSVSRFLAPEAYVEYYIIRMI